MKHRKAVALMAIATVLMVSGSLYAAGTSKAAPAVQDTPAKTMYVIGRGNVQVIRLYDAPDPLGKTMKTLPTGMPVEVLTDQLYNKYWYKTTEGFYAHVLYLSETDPAAMVADQAGDPTTEVDVERENELLVKYGDLTIVSKIMAGQVEVGFTMDQVQDAWGNPDSRTELQSTALGSIWQWIYSGRTDRNPRNTTTLKFDERKKLVDVKTEK
jgi:hypothetical protein